MIKERASAHIPSKFGDFEMKVYSGPLDGHKEHVALVSKGLDTSRPVSVRIHSECMTGDLFGSSRCDCGEQLTKALEIIDKDKGILIYLRQEGRGIGLVNKLKAYNLQDEGLNTIDANLHLGFDSDARVYDVAVKVLQDQGVKHINLITNNPLKIKALDESEIEVVGRIPLIISANEVNESYLATKKNLMGHLY